MLFYKIHIICLLKEDIQINTVNYRLQAESVLERTVYQSAEILKLEQQMVLLSKHGLNKLNEILISNTRGSGRNLSDFIAEHNFAAELIRFDSLKTPLYEPPGYNRPPDFVVARTGKTYFLQMKKLSESEINNRRNKLIDRIKRSLEGIPVGKFISITFTEKFKESDSESFIHFIETYIYSFPDNRNISYPSEGEQKAILNVFIPKSTQLEHLTVGSIGDKEWRDLTDEAENQVRTSLTKAIGAFEWENDEKNINLIVMEADRYDNIDISQAVYGTEVFSVLPEKSIISNRDSDGFFYDPKYTTKISGVIVLRRTDSALISRYKKTLFINEHFSEMVESVKEVIDIDEIFTVSDLPS